ncbi:two-component system histidine kinase PnpS [Virgibacillus alimentarius]|uniref:histidine kinase n=1 Tax=Virgibacillus alimentarius TaxID=698769 RepID=A0ABS4SBS8_9BACI|nr:MULTISPECIES: HAMP domain-containing sensor histidine kinase [Virgibacillus]MBP2258571.1 two-component system phosphate regulon sensor histidine kinase PhoR [Virgibacillus alimentarius]HLR68436.1 ATP-binding protein [Virgibacillus sp.]
MKALFSKSLILYALGILIIEAITGAILSQTVDNLFVLISVLLIEYIILLLILLHVFDKYIKPIKKATKTVDQLVQGNYRARIHHPVNGSIGILSNKINSLARSLSELSIHEQLQAEQLSTVIDNTESGLVLIDEKGFIHLVNRKFISMFGKTTKDYVGYILYDVLDSEKIHQVVQETFLYEKNVKGSITHYKDSEKSYLEIVGAPIFNEKNMLRGAVLVIYDITELKNLELMRKDFVANVSHELKTPITSIKGFTETLMDGAMNEEHSNEQFLEIIYQESNRLQLLVEDLLTLSSLERDGLQLVITEVDLSSLVKEIVPMIRHQAEQHQIEFHANVEENLFIQADKDKVKQVILNLLNNAISYTPAKGEITLTIEETKDFLQIQVRDTGIGMSLDVLPRIFERFYRVDKARSRNTGGTGLGLAIVKHIMEVHGGKITVKSELNKGSLFSVYFPKQV